MTGQFVNGAQSVLRFSDLPAEPRKMLPRIQDYEEMPLVTLEAAVDPLMTLVPDVGRMVSTVKQSHITEEHNLTVDESASILLYSMEWEPRDKSFYIILNQTLQAVNRNLLRPWFLYLRLVMTALAKLPSDARRLIVYRGVKVDLRAQYPTGSIIIWWGFSLCTTSLQVLNDERTLGRSGTRTMFNIECHSAKSIKSFSFYPAEEEVLLTPGCQFEVSSCLTQGEGLHIIYLKEIQPKFPLINPVPIPQSSHPPPILPPHCGNSRLQKCIDALYLDPVIISFCAITFARQLAGEFTIETRV